MLSALCPGAASRPPGPRGALGSRGWLPRSTWAAPLVRGACCWISVRRPTRPPGPWDPPGTGVGSPRPPGLRSSWECPVGSVSVWGPHSGLQDPLGPGLGSPGPSGLRSPGERAVGSLSIWAPPRPPGLQDPLGPGLGSPSPGVGEAASFIDRKQARGRARPGLGKLRAESLDRIPCLLRGPPSSLPGRGHCSVSRRNEGAAQVHADSACSHANQVIMSVVPELPFLPAPAHLKCPERRSLNRISVSFSRAFYEQASWQAAPSGGMLPGSALPHRPGLVLPSRNPRPDSSALGSVRLPPAAIVLAVCIQSINSSH